MTLRRAHRLHTRTDALYADWYIYADEETRMERLKQNRGYSEEKCRSIFRNQLSEDEFSDHCDFEIDNSDDFEKTKEQIQQKMQRMQIDEVM